MPGFQEKNQQEMKVLQINLDRGREALDLMSKTAREEQCDLCLIQEPNKKRTEDWYGHEDAKIKVLNQSHVVAKKRYGPGAYFLRYRSDKVYKLLYFTQQYDRRA